MLYDAAIIGGGVVGTLTARELSKYEIKTVLLEKNSDIAAGTTKANSGIVHAGYNARPGSLKAKLNVRGCALMEELCGLLHVPYRNNGSLVTAFCDDELRTLEILLKQGTENNVPELKIIGRDELKGLEPNISDEAAGALFAPTAGIVSPYELASAAAECAVLNGVTLIRNFKVTDIDFSDGLFSLNGGEIRSRLVINAAGLYASLLAEAFDGEKFETTPRLGEYGLLDQSCRDLVTHTIFQCPVKMGKGVLVTPTVHGNILVGPSAVDISDRDDVSVRRGALSEIFRKGAKSVPSLSMKDMICSFAGLRSHFSGGDFHIERALNNERFINLIGIDSPGLASSPAIAEYTAKLALKGLCEPKKKQGFNAGRRKPVVFRELSDDAKAALIAENPAYAEVVCRCETVTRGEIEDAIRAPAGARDLDGIKRRTRAGMGRCQGSFCGIRTAEILAKELGLPLTEITKRGEGSDIFYERTESYE